ncbi:Cyclohexanone 1,2-monooxygenase [Fusarium oxysporum f. sp. cubense race 1]|uniref:Cyclohexanone 1,2-monooxygenase n=1 Tax=Fusarium oxysporum f. sp. cubense (strain race 1) TaxID=1229664 RepID=N4UDK6_FUSC1|nr:Cyclohexanone 1,2-monooxygenase [Fusarium oxysporum f. sp. cubense race 1]
MTSYPDFDAVVVGAGFGGIYMCKKLVDQGLSVKLIEVAPDVGGTWYWNRYPGAMSDTPSMLYRYSWDLEDLQQYPWEKQYLQQHEVLAYLRHVVDRHQLRQHMQFNTEMKAATWDPDHSTWTVGLSSGQDITSRYLVTAIGLLSKQNYPEIRGLDSFKGEMYHTGSWPASYDFKNKRVGVIGNGSTGVQVITAIADEVKLLRSFQRHPQYVVPAVNRAFPPESRRDINRQWEDIWKQAKESMFGFGFEESQTPASSVTSEERERIFESAWQKGGGFNFMFGTFCDISYDEVANKEAADFIKRKIRQIVKDPVKAEKLIPTEHYARRPLCDTGYYEKFNSPNVDIIDVNETPITEITPKGVRTSDGAEYDLDVLVFATGFDAVDGNYKRIPIQGASNKTLKDCWADGPDSYLGISVSDFPNLFMILGPNGPFTNLPPTIETQVEFISDIIQHANGLARQNGKSPTIEAEREAVHAWSKICDELSANSLFRRTDSWIFGANVAGKKPSVLFYFGGLANYRNVLRDLINEGYKGFQPFLRDSLYSYTA